MSCWGLKKRESSVSSINDSFSHFFQLPISVKSSKPVSLIITHVTYNFLSLLPSTEPLSYRGRRLNDTVAQRHTPTYAPDIVLKVDIAEASNKLLINFADEQRLVLAQGETKSLDLRFNNVGTRPVKELWMVSNPDDQVWLNDKKHSGQTIIEYKCHSHLGVDADDWHETIESANSIAPRKPYEVWGDTLTLVPGESMDISIFLHDEQVGDKELCLLFVYREVWLTLHHIRMHYLINRSMILQYSILFK